MDLSEAYPSRCSTEAPAGIATAFALRTIETERIDMMEKKCMIMLLNGSIDVEMSREGVVEWKDW